MLITLKLDDPWWPSGLEHHNQMFYAHAQGRGFKSSCFHSILDEVICRVEGWNKIKESFMF